MHNNQQVIIDETDNPNAREIIKKSVRDYNIPYLGAWEAKSFTIYIKDTAYEIIAGAYGKYIPGELFNVDYFMVKEKHRNQKLGTALMKAVENFAKKNKAPHIDLYTMEFQATPFYEKQGFSLVAIVPRWARNYGAHFMRKAL